MSSPIDLLERLVGFPSVVGGPNGDVIGFVRGWLHGHGIASALIPGPEGDHWNLFATIGEAARPGYVLSGHLDVVPAAEPGWRADPFALRREGERLVGRGACDMKGFVAAALAVAPELAAMPLSVPIHIALSYDEEAGCRGVPHLLAALPDLCAPPLGAIIGEPSGMAPVLAHKGKAALRLLASGVAGHSARPDLGANAIHALLPALNAAALQAEALRSGPQDARFAPPWSSLQIGTVAGGQAVNIIPDRAEAQIEARAIHGADPGAILEPVVAAAEAAGLAVDWLSSYPALALEGEHPLARLVAGLTGTAPLGAVSYGTEAGLFQQAGIPAIICGPGDIARAHRPEEYLERGELQAACAMIRRLGQALCP
ncbi:acetylornithine deacetylase [Paracoccus binzhouensis]|uniref:acetylornithine deacetylase n=1 Tax=Paracoccus binzhouensis TaxID=2796149 RepID=UPI0018EF01CC|nr:acetylornithine deacetylase [Paracoccus binzhouensis]